MMITSSKIEPEKMYSAREAVHFVPTFKNEADFRTFLKQDIFGSNLFNAKVYTVKKQQRFVIRGNDLQQGIVHLA